MSHGHHHDHHEEQGAVPHEELNRHRIDLAYRDACAGLLIPLNECRKHTASLPWKCTDERHAYEKCEYLEYRKRVAALKAGAKP